MIGTHLVTTEYKGIQSGIMNLQLVIKIAEILEVSPSEFTELSDEHSEELFKGAIRTVFSDVELEMMRLLVLDRPLKAGKYKQWELFKARESVTNKLEITCGGV